MVKVIFGTTAASDGDWSGEQTTKPRIVDLVKDRHGETPTSAAWTNLIHATGHFEVAEGDHGLLGRGDALITQQPGVALGIRTADCVPIFLWGERTVAMVHAGMSGAAQGILPQIVSILTSRFDEPAEGLTMRVGPFICVTCYAVSAGNTAFLKGFPTAAEFIRRTGDKETFDLAAILADQAALVGITYVVTSAPCTHHDPDLFSARNGQKERLLSYIMLSNA